MLALELLKYFSTWLCFMQNYTFFYVKILVWLLLSAIIKVQEESKIHPLEKLFKGWINSKECV